NEGILINRSTAELGQSIGKKLIDPCSHSGKINILGSVCPPESSCRKSLHIKCIRPRVEKPHIVCRVLEFLRIEYLSLQWSVSRSEVKELAGSPERQSYIMSIIVI